MQPAEMLTDMNSYNTTVSFFVSVKYRWFLGLENSLAPFTPVMKVQCVTAGFSLFSELGSFITTQALGWYICVLKDQNTSSQRFLPNPEQARPCTTKTNFLLKVCLTKQEEKS